MKGVLARCFLLRRAAQSIVASFSEYCIPRAFLHLNCNCFASVRAALLSLLTHPYDGISAAMQRLEMPHSASRSSRCDNMQVSFTSSQQLPCHAYFMEVMYSVYNVQTRLVSRDRPVETGFVPPAKRNFSIPTMLLLHYSIPLKTTRRLCLAVSVPPLSWNVRAEASPSTATRLHKKSYTKNTLRNP